MFAEEHFQQACSQTPLAVRCPNTSSPIGPCRFEAVQGWRYDRLPDQVYIDVSLEAKVRIDIRYIGSGRWRLDRTTEVAPQ
ncbi:hypothetical protein GCM10009856_00010 [Mycolicibacterium llatzerense]